MPANVANGRNGTRDTRIDLPLSVACIRGGSDEQAFSAAKRTEESLRALVRVLEHGRRAMNRAAAARALAEVTDTKAIAALERVVANKLEDPKVRGYAAEALAHQHRKESHRVLLKNLTDRCEEVRFWCAFAIGEMAEMDPLPLLESLSKNRAKRVRSTGHVKPINGVAIDGFQQKLVDACQFCVAS